MTIQERVKALIIKQLRIDAGAVIDSASFANDLDADSLKVTELVLAFETEFGITVPDEDVESIATVADAVRYITDKTA